MNVQIQRIKDKLIKAKYTDVKLKVFGAERHKYILGKPLYDEDILKFEKEYDLKLPESYKAFLLHIGNGGISYSDSGSGPFYGIYPLGNNVSELIENTKYLKRNCVLYPDMTDAYWKDLTKKVDENDISDEDYENELGKIYSGILPLGSQGCTYIHALVLNGEHKGRVVNIDLDQQKPRFTFESNFLDWYERWLDEVISGDLIKDTPSWFGYKMGGSEEEILKLYFLTSDNKTKINCLEGLLNKQKLESETIQIIEEQYKISCIDQKKAALQILTKFDYEKAKSYLIEFVEESLQDVFQFIFWYAKDKSRDWLSIIESNIEKINNEETFRFCSYLLKEMNVDYGYLIVPFTSHDNDNIRVSAYYSLGQLNNKNKYTDTFIVGLNDSSNRVIHTTLQALEGIKDKRLLKHYKNIAERFPKEQDYILVNLNHRLKSYGFTTTTIKNIDIDNYYRERKWFHFWK